MLLVCDGISESEERRRKNDLVCWFIPTYTRMWDKAYQEAQSFYDKNGNLSIPTTEKRLFTWIVAQRRKFFEGKLSQVQIDKLNSIGMRWNQRKNCEDAL